MKKITFLLIIVFLATLSFAQVAKTNTIEMLHKATKDSPLQVDKPVKKYNPNLNSKGVIYSEDFESESPTYTITNHFNGNPSAGIIWKVDNRTGFFAEDYCSIREYTNENQIFLFSENPVAPPYDANNGKSAYILGEYTVVDWYPGKINSQVSSSISTPAINFTGINSSPIISFDMYARWINQTWLILQWSDDDWATVNVVDTIGNYYNGFQSNNTYYRSLNYVLNGVENKANVKIRFYWDQPAQGPSDAGYFAFIDNIIITHAPECEAVILKNQIGFFTNDVMHTLDFPYLGKIQWKDELGDEYYTNRGNEAGWHHRFGNIPIKYQEDSLDINFQVTSQQLGSKQIQTQLKVYLMEVPGTTALADLDTTTAIWTATAVGKLISTNEIDTVSIIGSNAFRFKDLPIGNYAVRYEISSLDVNGVILNDSNINNNTAYDRFRVTENIASQDYLIGNEADSYTGWHPNYTTPIEYYLFPMTVFHKAALNKVSVLIDNESNIGSSMVFTVLKDDTDPENTSQLARFPITDMTVDITAENKGKWIDITFPTDSINIFTHTMDYEQTGPYQVYGRVYLRVEFINVGDSMASVSTLFKSQEEYYNIYTALPTTSTQQWTIEPHNIPIVHYYFDDQIDGIDQAIESSFAVYPNPANSQITITNSENKTINVTNISGQLVKTIVASSEYQTIDINDLSNGMYFVQVGNEVVKVNIIK